MSEENQKKVVKFCTRKISTIKTMSACIPSFRKVNFVESADGRKPTVIDGGADTGLKGDSYNFLEHTKWGANVVGFDEGLTKTNLPIGSCVTATLDAQGKAIILLENEQIDHTSQSNSMMSLNQMRAFGVDIDDCPPCFEVGGRYGQQRMKIGEHKIPFEYTDGLVLLKTSVPSIQELESCPILILTSDAPWHPNKDESLGGEQLKFGTLIIPLRLFLLVCVRVQTFVFATL